jgi:Zn-dependent protease
MKDMRFMFRSWRIGTAFAIPLYIHPTFLLLPAIVFASSWDDGLFNALVMTAAVLVLFGCVVLHELGHALTARAFGIRTRDITLYPIGGVASLERMTERPLQEIGVALAGPAVNLVIVCLLAPVAVLALFGGVLNSGGLLTFQLGEGAAVLAMKFAVLLMLSNAALMIFNLIPAFPMDGGRVLRALLALAMDRVRATEVASVVGLVWAGLMVVVGLTSPLTGIGTPFLALLGAFVAFAGRLELIGVRRLAEEARQAAAADQPMEPIWEESVPPAPNFSGFRWDRRGHVWVLWRNGRPIEVYDGGAD